MYKDRSSSVTAEGSLYRDGSKKRLDDGVEKPSASTSKGGIGKEKERLGSASAVPAAAASSQSRRQPGPPVEKAKYTDDGKACFSLWNCGMTCVRSFLYAVYSTAAVVVHRSECVL